VEEMNGFKKKVESALMSLMMSVFTNPSKPTFLLYDHHHHHHHHHHQQQQQNAVTTTTTSRSSSKTRTFLEIRLGLQLSILERKLRRDVPSRMGRKPA